MQLTEILSSEHRVIESVIAALDAAAHRHDAGEALRPRFFVDAARFLRDFADGYHHAKEEGALFEAMARNGMPVNAGPIGVMCHEHERAREFTAGLRDAAELWAAGDDGKADLTLQYARAYAELLTPHIFKEDRILFPMATQVIPPDQEAQVLDLYAAKEREQAAKGSKDSLVQLARTLCQEAGVDPENAPRRPFELPCHAA